jgi:hypothetical protein
MGKDNPSFWGEMSMRLKEGDLCNTLGSSFMVVSIISLSILLSCNTFNEMAQLRLIIYNLIFVVGIKLV